MITQINNKALTEVDLGTHAMVCDGPVLGGCGKGEVGDPRTWLPDLWRDVVDKYGVKSVLDVGCGYGYSTKWFSDEGLRSLGIEGSTAIAREAVFPNLLPRDEFSGLIQHDFRDGRPDFLGEYDLCWCSEFLEHVRAEYEPCYMAAIVRCRYALISAALPGFGGHHHVNEQPSEYWIERFGRYGFKFLRDETNRLRRLAHDAHPNCYFQQNGLLFERAKDVRVRTHWTDLDGDLKPGEAERLMDLARGRRVLLVGGGGGQMALALAETAKQVTITDVADDDLGELLVDIRRAGFDGRVEVPIGESIASEEIAARRFEMAVIADVARIATEDAPGLLLPGGHLVWGNWDEEPTRDVVSEAGIDPRHVLPVGSFGILETAKWRVMLVMPHNRGVELPSYKTLRMGSIGRFTESAAEMDMDCGHLCHNFNSLLSQCLDWRDEGKASHLFMCHSDVAAERGCVDLLAEEMHQHGLIALSAVVAIKDPEGDRTSTAIGSKSKPWYALRYIHCRQFGHMPTTFTGKDVCRDDDEVLLINTGCMLLDLRHEFWDEFVFNAPAAIFKQDGKRAPIFRPEDWEMSRELDRAGVPYGATWRPVTEHFGVSSWRNRPKTGAVLENA